MLWCECSTALMQVAAQHLVWFSSSWFGEWVGFSGEGG
jgi:hypothetical protein